MLFFRYIVLLIIILVVFIFTSGKSADNKTDESREVARTDSVVLVFAGDIMGHMPQIEAAFDKSNRTYNFSDCYKYIAPSVTSADLAVANLEVPLAGRPYSGYPRFSSPDELLYGAISAGFDVMQLANNHIADRGKEGIIRTFNIVNQHVKSIGVYPNPALRDSLYPLLVTVKGVKIALLNCTFGTNGHVVPSPMVVNLIDSVQIKKDIQKARSKGAQSVIMTIHWGNEYELYANRVQRNLANMMVRAGVDVIVGSHPHVVQNFENISNADGSKVPVFYSLGNFISNQRWTSSNGGILARIVLSGSTGKVIESAYMPFYVYKGTLNRRFQYYIIPTKHYLSGEYPFRFTTSEDSMLVTFDKDTRTRLINLRSWE